MIRGINLSQDVAISLVKREYFPKSINLNNNNYENKNEIYPKIF